MKTNKELKERIQRLELQLQRKNIEIEELKDQIKRSQNNGLGQ